MIFPKNGGSVDAIDHFWGECSSKVIFLGGVEIKLVDFGGSVVPFHKNWGSVDAIDHFWGECSSKVIFCGD